MKRVLIVDDEVDLCLLLKQFLTKRNYEVHIAHTLSEGLNILNTIKPDLLMLDNNLPDGMGWDLADDIHKKYPSMNITLLSAFQLAKDFKHKLDTSINFLEKPISLKDIEKYI
ncbi:MAG: response regulator [Ferruginibacter sp.]